MNDLQKMFEYVRKTFFPQWDRKKQWKIKQDENLPSRGSCDCETKTISINLFMPSRFLFISDLEFDAEDDLLLLLIHEVCHSSNMSHGKKWQNRFLKKAEIAEKLGRSTLADMIRGEVSHYRECIELGFGSATHVYNQLADWTFERPEIPYDEMIRMIAANLGIYPDEFKKKYKRSRKVYDQAKNDAEADPKR